jgi:histone deacetylase 1/2
MASVTAIKMIVAFAAGLGIKLYAVDFEQAFLNAPVDVPDLYIQLPDLPYELQGGECGPTRGTLSSDGRRLVGRLNKAMYGLKDAPRAWARHLHSVLSSDKVGVRFTTTDRNVFRFDWKGEVLLGCIHVDDILFAPASATIKTEFLRRVRSQFVTTGGDEPATEFCGMEFAYDTEQQTIKMHQSDFERRMLTKYGAMSFRPVETPKNVGQGPLQPYAGTVPEEKRLDYLMFIGDLTWVVRTNPRLAFIAQELSHFVTNPGPVHFAAARRVLANIRGRIGQGITFHGSDRVLKERYDHRHMLLGACDSDFSHVGLKSTSSVVVMMNGGPIYHAARRQSTVSANTGEAEVKAAAAITEILSSIVPLWCELTGVVHPPVRCLIDNVTAKKQVENGVDTPAAASYHKHVRYVESRVYSCLLWFDPVPGSENYADVGTKQVRDTAEFLRKDGIISGCAPSMYETEEMTLALQNQRG